MLILIVEDDPMVALDLEDIVLEHASAKVLLGTSIRSATKMLEQPVDFALFDVDLPDGKSHCLATALQKKNVPFAFVSGSSREELPQDLRAAPFVTKPYSADDITQALEIAWSKQLEPVH